MFPELEKVNEFFKIKLCSNSLTKIVTLKIWFISKWVLTTRYCLIFFRFLCFVSIYRHLDVEWPGIARLFFSSLKLWFIYSDLSYCKAFYVKHLLCYSAFAKHSYFLQSIGKAFINKFVFGLFQLDEGLMGSSSNIIEETSQSYDVQPALQLLQQHAHRTCCRLKRDDSLANERASSLDVFGLLEIADENTKKKVGFPRNLPRNLTLRQCA